MAVSITKADGVTVFTLTVDPKSNSPPLCQILKALCYSPVWCSVSQHLRRVQGSSQSVLGALQILIGLLNIGLGVMLLCSRGGSWWQMDETMFPIWLGVLFMVFGIMCVLSKTVSSPCMVASSVILNLAGIGFAITAIVLYSINFANIYVSWMCRDEYYYYSHHPVTTPPSPGKSQLLETCLAGQAVAEMLIKSINALLIALSSMELCINISSVILGIKALRSNKMEETEITDEPEIYKPLLEEVTTQ